MSTTITIEVDGLPPPELRGNGRRRTHWAQQRRIAEDWLWLVRQGLEPWWGHLPQQPWPVAEAEVVFVVPDHKRRDEDNWTIALKELWDYLCPPTPQRHGIGLIKDDSAECLTVNISFEVDKERAPRTIITLTRKEDLHGD